MESLNLFEQISAFDTWSLVLCVFVIVYFMLSSLIIFWPKKCLALTLVLGGVILVSNVYITPPESLVKEINGKINSCSSSSASLLTAQSSRLEALVAQMDLAYSSCL